MLATLKQQTTDGYTGKILRVDLSAERLWGGAPLRS